MLLNDQNNPKNFRNLDIVKYCNSNESLNPWRPFIYFERCSYIDITFECVSQASDACLGKVFGIYSDFHSSQKKENFVFTSFSRALKRAKLRYNADPASISSETLVKWSIQDLVRSRTKVRSLSTFSSFNFKKISAKLRTFT